MSSLNVAFYHLLAADHLKSVGISKRLQIFDMGLFTIQKSLPILLLSIGAVLDAPLLNLIVSVPQGTVYNPNLGQFYSPAFWTDILTFFYTNYVTHAATACAKQGSSAIEKPMHNVSDIWINHCDHWRAVCFSERR